MTPHAQTEGSIEVVHFSGRLDASTAPDFRDELMKHIADGRTRIVIDLEAVPFADSSGLGALVAAYKATEAAGGGLALCGVQPTVRTLLELTRIHRVISVVDDVAAARAELEK